jgi:uncharacterized protein YaiI (UPF0178 family)
MKTWAAADACPAVIKDIRYSAANRAQVPLMLIANQMLCAHPSPWIRSLQMPFGFDVAAQVIANGAAVLHPRGGVETGVPTRRLSRYVRWRTDEACRSAYHSHAKQTIPLVAPKPICRKPG